MPKVSWDGMDEDTRITADDIDSAEEGYTAYAGEVPPGGVYRFRVKRAKYTEFNTGSLGLNVILELDGSWKEAHRKYDGCTVWDRIVMTKAAASFVKAFAAGIGVSSTDLVSRVITDEDGYVTKIGKKTLADAIVYVAMKRGRYNDEPRLEKAGTGYQVVEGEVVESSTEETPAKPANLKASLGTSTKGKGKKSKAKADEDEPPF